MEGSNIEQENACTEAPPGSIANVQLELLVAKTQCDHFSLELNQCASEEID